MAEQDRCLKASPDCYSPDSAGKVAALGRSFFLFFKRGMTRESGFSSANMFSDVFGKIIFTDFEDAP